MVRVGQGIREVRALHNVLVYRNGHTYKACTGYGENRNLRIQTDCVVAFKHLLFCILCGREKIGLTKSKETAADIPEDGRNHGKTL